MKKVKFNILDTKSLSKIFSRNRPGNARICSTNKRWSLDLRKATRTRRIIFASGATIREQGKILPVRIKFVLAKGESKV
ncbi:MAG: hypothetical protein CVV41_09945 [Candidatus Riflebacteria bacterium HGW-Riflebacteria-1]|jgi:hypothetical protein|nr:MAG: hypothetical protein CVV41_09945 [Candidatus Riflebacteria bacterium HGW-Riflebacteria-1]